MIGLVGSLSPPPRINVLKRKRLKQSNMDFNLRLAPWNVRTLLRPAAFRTVADCFEKYRVNIVAVLETR